MRRAFLTYCDCGTPLLRATCHQLTADAWTQAFEGGDPDAKIKLKQIYQYYRLFPSAPLPDGSFDPGEQCITECPACHAPLKEDVCAGDGQRV